MDEQVFEVFNNLPDHKRIAIDSIEKLGGDDRVVGIFLSGSFASGQPDQFSDIDLNIVVKEGVSVEEVVSSHSSLRSEVSDVATTFPATHLNDPNQIIVFYKNGSTPIHVDFQYIARDELKPHSKYSGMRVVMDKSEEKSLEKIRDDSAELGPEKEDPLERLQYFESRFWGWCLYTLAKIERGELWEARDAVESVRSMVLLSLLHLKHGLKKEGARRLEGKFTREELDLLEASVSADHSKSGYKDALRQLIRGYEVLFLSVAENENIDQNNLPPVDREYVKKTIG